MDCSRVRWGYVGLRRDMFVLLRFERVLSASRFFGVGTNWALSRRSFDFLQSLQKCIQLCKRSFGGPATLWGFAGSFKALHNTFHDTPVVKYLQHTFKR